MALAQIGPLTNVAEALATVIGAGTLLGSFGLGAAAMLFGRRRANLEARVLTDGYFGGILAALAGLVDLVLR